MLQKLSIVFVQVKAGNASNNSLNVYTLYQAKKINKKVYSTIMNSIKIQYTMDIIFVNSGNSRAPASHRLLLDLDDKID